MVAKGCSSQRSTPRRRPSCCSRDLGRISLTNEPARELFFEGRDPQGENFQHAGYTHPTPFGAPSRARATNCYPLTDNHGERQTYLLSKRRSVAGGEPIVVVIAKNLSRDFHRQEADAWKRMIRVFSHELNNSLAPVSSLVHSARVVVSDTPLAAKLERIFSTITERTDHLRTFLDAYPRFARLPSPHPQEVPWGPSVDRTLALFPGGSPRRVAAVRTSMVRSGQLEQVIINLLKNAEQSGSPTNGITLAVTSLGPRGARLTVADRGPGMSPHVIETARRPILFDQGTGYRSRAPAVQRDHRSSRRLAAIGKPRGGWVELSMFASQVAPLPRMVLSASSR